MNLVVQGMSIRQTITGFGISESLQDVSEIAAGLFAVGWNVIRFKSKCKADVLAFWKRQSEIALFAFSLSFSVFLVSLVILSLGSQSFVS